MQIDTNSLYEQFVLLSSNILIHAMIISAVGDIITGTAVAFKKCCLHSRAGLQGAIKHLCVLVLMLISYPYMTLLNLDIYANWIVGFFILSYIISIIENLAAMGVPIPEFLTRYLYQVKNKKE